MKMMKLKIKDDCAAEMLSVVSAFSRDFIRKKYRNCVLILFQNRIKLTDGQFIQLFEDLVERSCCIDYVKDWDKNSQYKYYKLLDDYFFTRNKYVSISYLNY